MIKSIEVGEVKIVYSQVSLKEYLHDYARFNLYEPIHKQWADIYKLPAYGRIIYIYHESNDSYGSSIEHEGGFLILEPDEVVIDRHADLKEFCLNNLDRIIHADPDER